MTNFLLRCRSSYGLKKEQRHANGKREEDKLNGLAQTALKMSVKLITDHVSHSEGYPVSTPRKHEMALR